MANRVDILIKARDEASKQFAKIGNSVNRMSKMIIAGGAAAAAVLSARAIKAAVEDTLQSYGRQEAAVIKLGKALDLMGKKYQTREFEEFAGSIQKITTIGDEAVLEMATLGASIGKLSGQDLQDATKAAIGLASAFGMDTTAAMRLVARAAVGDTTTLARYGIKLKEGATDAEKFAEVLAIGAKNFGLAEAEANTFNGRMEQMKNAVDDVKEVIGGALAPVIASMAAGIKSFAENWAKDIALAVMNTISFIKVMGQNWKLVFELLANQSALAIITLFNDIKYWITDALPQYLEWFRNNWKALFVDLFNGTKAIFSNLATNIKEFFKAVWEWIKGGEWEFEWTPLLDGFKKTMEDLPDIAERELTALEQGMKKNIDGIKKTLGDKLQLEFSANAAKVGFITPEETDEEKARRLAENAKYKPADGATAKDLFKTTGTTSTVESRFLQNAPQNNYYSNMIKHNSEIAKNTRELKSLPNSLDNIAAALNKFQNNGGLAGLTEVGI